MFGYVQAFKPELKFKEYDVYRAYYCGLCSTLKKKYGFQAQITVGYDMVFLILLLTGLYDTETTDSMQRCIVSPKKHLFKTNIFTDYAADMHVLYTYMKMLDDWKDEKKITRFLESKLLSSGYKNKLAIKYPEKIAKLTETLKKSEALEKANVKDYEKLSSLSGEAISILFDYKKDVWNERLKKIGYYLGKYIYILDAYEDIEKDIEKKCYNPFKDIYKEINGDNEKFGKICYDILLENIAECSREFEMLPVIENVEILNNILFMGVWNKFSEIKEKRRKREDERSI